MGVAQTFFGTAKTAVITYLDTNITHGAVGDDNTAPVVGNTALGNEDFREAEFEKSTGADFFTTAIFLDTTENNSNTIAEVGTFDDPTTGTMYSRALTNSIAKTSTVEVFIEVRFLIEVATS